MAKEKYRLQAMLTIKQREKKRAEVALAIAIKELNEAKKREEKLIKEKEDIIKSWQLAKKKMTKEMAGGSSIFDGNVHTNFLKKLKEDEEEKEKEIEEQKEVVAEAEEEVAKARRDYIDAAKELQIMEKHKELWVKKVQKEINRKEESELNDLGNIIHQLRKWRGDQTGI